MPKPAKGSKQSEVEQARGVVAEEGGPVGGGADGFHPADGFGIVDPREVGAEENPVRRPGTKETHLLVIVPAPCQDRRVDVAAAFEDPVRRMRRIAVRPAEMGGDELEAPHILEKHLNLLGPAQAIHITPAHVRPAVALSDKTKVANLLENRPDGTVRKGEVLIIAVKFDALQSSGGNLIEVRPDIRITRMHRGERDDHPLRPRAQFAVPNGDGAADDAVREGRLGGNRTAHGLVNPGEFHRIEVVRQGAVPGRPERALGHAAHAVHRTGGKGIGKIVAMDVYNHIERKLARLAQATAS